MRIYFLLLICLTLFNCRAAEPIAKGTIVIGIETAPQSFDPRLPTDSASQKINKLMYNGLLRVDADLQLVPDLALSYQMTDSTTYVFYLRENVVFHNQKKLTSLDVKATYDSMRSIVINSPFKPSLDSIDEIQAPDDATVVFKLKRPNSPFPTLMTIGILPSELATTEKNANGNAIVPYGTGPYQFDHISKDLNEVTITAFADHFAGRPKNNKLIFRVLTDSTLRTLELKKGRLDLVLNQIPYVLIGALEKEPHLKFSSSVGINFTYMAFNFKNHYLKNLKVRQAISLAIDRDRIIKYKLHGLATKAATLIIPGHWAYNQDLSLPQFNPAAAKILLDEAGFRDPDGSGALPRFSITYKTSSIKERVEIAQLIAENLAQVGIDVEVKSYEFGTFYRDIRQGDFDIFTLSWVGITDPDIYYSTFHSSMTPPNGANRGFYKNKGLDKLLDYSREETDRKVLVQLYQKIAQVVARDTVYAPLWYENNYSFANRDIEGFTLRPDASYVNLRNAFKR